MYVQQGTATSANITSTAVLGTFNKNDTLAVQFVGGWDECSRGTYPPSWSIQNLQLVFGKAGKASTFVAAATASQWRGSPDQILTTGRGFFPVVAFRD
jgi:hypothetical protein